ncbi:MAG: hypothetical protein ACREIS_11550 [Nitrospiraceae bacterium]
MSNKTSGSAVKGAVILALLAAAGYGIWEYWGKTAAPKAAEELKRQTREAVDTTTEYANSRKQALDKAFQAEVDALDARIKGLRAQAANASADARADLDMQIAHLEAQKQEALKKVKRAAAELGK